MSASDGPTLADQIAADEIAILPGSFNALSAHIVERAGFEAVYVSGAGVSNARLGLADVGLATATEMRDQIADIAARVEVPILADGDTGYGNPINVHRTISLYEQAGAAGIQLEDQEFPKQCGHFDDATVIPAAEMVEKIRAARDAREDDAFQIIARTDARAGHGVEEAIRRGNLYAEAGADLIFPEAPRSTAEMERFVSEIESPVMANMVEDGKTPLQTASDLEAIGYDLVIFPNSLLRTAMQAMIETAEHLRETGDTSELLDTIADFDLRNNLTDRDRLDTIEETYSLSE